MKFIYINKHAEACACVCLHHIVIILCLDTYPKIKKNWTDRVREIYLKNNYESISRMKVYLVIPQSSALRHSVRAMCWETHSNCSGTLSNAQQMKM